MFRKNSQNKKTLQYKLAAVNEKSGSDVFDLSECGISKIPDGVFEKCKLTLKKVLILSHNNLEEIKGGGDLKNLSGLVTLDLSNNVMTKLNKSLHLLSSLQKLDLCHNKFKELPDSIGRLFSLKSLLLADNQLSSLPQSIKSLQQLEELDVSQNKWMTSLPVNLCYLKAIKVFRFDFERITYPAKEITAGGIREVRRFFTELKGDQYDFTVCDGCPINESSMESASLQYGHSDLSTRSSTLPAATRPDDHFEEFIRKRELKKEISSKQFALNEKESAEGQSARAMLILDSQSKRHKELAAAAKYEMNSNQTLMKTLDDEEQRHKRILKQLQIEDTSNTLEFVQKISERARKTDVLLEELDRDQCRINDLVKVEESKYLQKEDIIKKMSTVLQETIESQKKWDQFEFSRDEAWKKSIQHVAMNSPDVDSLLEEKDRAQEKLIKSIIAEQESQMKAFEILQSQKDAKLNRIHMQLAMVQTELARLSMLELDKKQEQNKNDINALSIMRVNTATLLSQLMQDRDSREESLKQSIREMDSRRDKGFEDYWFIQFQRLMEKNNLKKYMTSQRNVNSSETSVCVNELNIYVNDSNSCMNKIDSNENYIKAVEQQNEETNLLQHEYRFCASKNAFKELECVVCMDAQPEVVFLPCGHVCSCAKCHLSLGKCPMCRHDILLVDRILIK